MNLFSVLIVDDNEDDRYLLKRDLDQTGLNLKVFEKKDGEDALEFFHNYEENRKLHPHIFPPLVIFLDINMPKIDGFTFLKEFTLIRQQFSLKSSIVIMFSSSERPEEREKALSYDFVSGYLTKGKFGLDDLSSKIKEVAKNHNPDA